MNKQIITGNSLEGMTLINTIPNNFDNFKQQELQRGIETISETEYKGYIIRLRAYNMSGISGKIIKVGENGKRITLRERNYNFMLPLNLLTQLKEYIDNFELNLIKKLEIKINKKINKT